jgi:hypothetical protein
VLREGATLFPTSRFPAPVWSLLWLVALSVARCSSPTDVLAQRQPVLRQVRVPHPYYWREMYIPQRTTGAGAATWAPDGRALIYAMDGSLWRQALGATEARQLTDGPGSDHQPDWSPDGRFVAYASYRDDAMQLRLLDLRDGTDHPLVTDGAVNLEPRWSPDGRRIAFVSTVHEGRFHVFVAPFNGRSLGPAERVTEDLDSGLPRYYYGRHDQYLSPVWSPDGSELLVVSNRARIWGSGGLWRVAARSGALMRPVRDEETTWRARPDWSRDGRRIVYASYLGRQWHQLFLLPAGGGDPVQLTYGDFDATDPRWSPDGRRIAYVSNEDGNTSLWTVAVPGGRRERVRVSRRAWLRAHGAARITLVDGRTGRPMPGRLVVRDAAGRSYAPTAAWIHADDGFDRRERTREVEYFHSSGRATVLAPAGVVTVEATRGLEYAVGRATARIVPGDTTDVRITLRRVATPSAQGWRSGDLHVHMNYGGHYRNTPERLAAQASAEGLDLVENLIVNKESRIPDVAYFRGGADAATRAHGVLIAHDQEFHTSLWGHLGLLGLTRHIILPDYAAYPGTAAASPWPLNADVIAQTRAQGAVAGYVHPFDAPPAPDDPARPLTNEFPIDVALGLVDYYEAVGFADDYLATLQVWYQALNCGFRIAAGAGTDAMANFASLRGPVGMNRVYVKVQGSLTHRSFLEGLRAGRTFATNGPLLGFAIDGREPGASLDFPAGARTVRARVSLRSIVPVDHLEIVSNGAVVSSIALPGDHTRADTTVILEVSRSAWFTLRARTEGPRAPILDGMVLATTSPVYVTLGGAPIRSTADAAFFLAWIDRVRAFVEANNDWNDDAERRAALGRIAAARSEFERRSRQ